MAYFIPNETDAGIELTDKEKELIRDMKKLATKWKKHGNRLWLYSASGTLCVMMYEGESNPNPTMGGSNPSNEGVNPDNQVTSIDIPNDGGDW